jgi:hypothetical protein
MALFWFLLGLGSFGLALTMTVLFWIVIWTDKPKDPQVDTALADRIRDAIEAQRLAGVETGAAYEAWRLQQERDDARRIMGAK